jgi:homoserine dehydrogenase
LYYGAGAGGDATASAVISDIINIARNGKSSPMLGFKKALEENLTLANIDEIETKYYIRVEVEDKNGVLAKISTILSQNNISIETMLQKSIKKDGAVNLLLSTHKAKEIDIQKAIKEINVLECVKSKSIMMRVED